MRKLTIAALACCVSAAPAQARYTIGFAQVGNNVVATGSGSFDLTTLSKLNDGITGANLQPSSGQVLLGSTTNVVESRYTNVTSTGAGFGMAGMTVPTSASGSVVKLSFGIGFIYLPTNYISGTELGISTETYANQTFSTLGLTSGTYTMNWGSGQYADSASVIIPSAALAPAAPEPAVWGLMVLGFGAVGGMRRRRRRALVTA